MVRIMAYWPNWFLFAKSASKPQVRVRGWLEALTLHRELAEEEASCWLRRLAECLQDPIEYAQRLTLLLLLKTINPVWETPLVSLTKLNINQSLFPPLHTLFFKPLI